MAILGQMHPRQQREIIFFQTTVDCLNNNTIMIDYYNLGEKILDEGHRLVFHGYDGTPTVIENAIHLKNYINNIAGFRHI
jgi:hypothetical protein